MSERKSFAILVPGMLIAAFLFGMTGKARAQTSTDPNASMARAAAQSDPGTRAIVQDGNPSLTLESGEEGTLATGRIGFTRDIGNDRLQTLLSFQASPNSDGEAAFLNLDGLTGGTSATLKFTYEHFHSVTGGMPGETLTQICDSANLAIVEDFKTTHSAAGQNKPCTEATFATGGATLINTLAKKKNEILESMCQEVDKTKGVDLLAPPGEDRSAIPGYNGTCSEKALADLQKSENEKLSAGELTKACAEFDKAHPTKALSGCTPEELAKRSVAEAVASKVSGALVEVCREDFVVPDSKLFRTGRGPNTCRFSSLLDFAFTTSRPAFWYRRILRALPVKFWYWTVSGTEDRQTFKFFDPDADFAVKRVGKESTRLEGSGSLFYRGWFYSIGAGRENQFSAARSEKVCFPRDGSPGALNCVEGALAGPDNESFDFVRGEIRTLIRPNFGVSLRGIYDTSAKDLELHLLLHFLKSQTEGLNGGIDVQYNSAGFNKTVSNPRGDNFGVRLFVGSKFNLPFLPGQPPSSLNSKN